MLDVGSPLFFTRCNRTTYAKVAGKYQDVLTLESSVAELHQMFLDFALLTEQQGELLDQIEYQVKGANDHVESANEEVVEAIVFQKAIRKKQWYVLNDFIKVSQHPKRTSWLTLVPY
jgi:t-SNARE complex subunit (syntaxin)